MQCAQCGKPALVRVKRGESEFGLCLSCNVLDEIAQDMEFRRTAATFNHVAAMLDMQMGGLLPPTPRMQIPPPSPLALGALNVGNIHVENSSVGVINTGTIQSIANAVGVLRQTGQNDLATALAVMTAAVSEDRELSSDAKNQVAEALSVAAEEAAKPPEQRRLNSVRTLLLEASGIVGGVAGLSQLWGTHGATILNYFGL
jgi:hypothetical protein